MPDSSDQQLADRASHGDHGALGQLLENNKQRLYHIILHMVGDRDDAVGVTQEVMFKAVAHISDFKGQADVSTWMIRIAMNLSSSLLCKRRIERTTRLKAQEADGEVGHDQLSSLRQQLADVRQPSCDARAEHVEKAARLGTCLSRLQDDLRAVLLLRDSEEMDYDQIAQVMAIPIGTIKGRLFRPGLR